MTDNLINMWRDAIKAEARAASTTVLLESADELDRLLTGAREAQARGAAAADHAEATSHLVDSLRDVLASAPREMFLSSAAFAMLVDTQCIEKNEYPAQPGCDPREVARMLASILHNRVAVTLIQRHPAPLPSGRYAVVISFHPIGATAESSAKASDGR